MVTLTYRPHSLVRLRERYGWKEPPRNDMVDLEVVHVVNNVADLGHRKVCRYKGSEIYFVVQVETNEVLTFLTREQAFQDTKVTIGDIWKGVAI